MLQSDAPDVHPVDGIPEIAAERNRSLQSLCKKLMSMGRSSKRRMISICFIFAPIMHTGSIKLKKGKAVFRLVSEKAKKCCQRECF
jgi:hypothetical protein